MQRIALIITLVGLLLYSGSARAQGIDPLAAQLAAEMPGLLAKHHTPGAVIAVIHQGEVAWTEAYGVANTRTGAAMRPEMIMNFGSCGKVLTAWAVMRLVESGQVTLDAPVNRYLKRWQVQSAAYDANSVTVRSLLSHTAGLSVHGYSDYRLGRALPTLVEVLEGKNQTDGALVIQIPPGTQFQYSGGGFALLQMLIEDVSGKSFDAFLQDEVTEPLGVHSLHWVWTPELEQAAAMPHDSQGTPVGARQLAVPAVGSELSSTADFARLIAAIAAGPNGEPPGRGVLTVDSVNEMIKPQPHTSGEAGLAYGLARVNGESVVMHFGSNLGWNAFFILAPERGEGLVMATNSANAFPLLTEVQNLWSESVLAAPANVIPPVTDRLGMQGRIVLGIATALWLAWLVTAVVFTLRLKGSRRKAQGRYPILDLVGILLWGMAALFWWYWLYAPSPVLLPTGMPDVWPIQQAVYVQTGLLTWVALSAVMADTHHARQH